MSIIKCPECETEVSSHAPACPKCGFPVSGRAAHVESPSRLPWLITGAAVLALAVLAIIFLATRGGEEDAPSVEVAAAVPQTEEAAAETPPTEAAAPAGGSEEAAAEPVTEEEHRKSGLDFRFEGKYSVGRLRGGQDVDLVRAFPNGLE